MAVVAAAAFLVWLLFISGDDESDSGTEGLGGQQIEKSVDVVSASELPAAVAGAGYPVYWLGPQQGVDYEVTLITDGRTYIRYLPRSEEAETETPYLTVGSYAQSDAVSVIERLGSEQGAETESIPNGGVVLINEDGPTRRLRRLPGHRYADRDLRSAARASRQAGEVGVADRGRLDLDA